FADPGLISWCLGFVKAGAKAAGRDPRRIEIMSAAPVWVSTDLNVARERVRWFPALVSNHVVDLVSRYKPEELPSTLTSYIRNRETRRSEEHTSELQSRGHLVCRLLLEKKKSIFILSIIFLSC